MIGYRFYAEMPDDWASKSGCKSHRPFTRATLKDWAAAGQFCNVVAVCTGRESRMPHMAGGPGVEAFSAVYSHDNSDVCFSSASWDYLRKRCVTIDEATARKLHPALFARLD